MDTEQICLHLLFVEDKNSRKPLPQPTYQTVKKKTDNLILKRSGNITDMRSTGDKDVERISGIGWSIPATSGVHRDFDQGMQIEERWHEMEKNFSFMRHKHFRVGSAFVLVCSARHCQPPR
ncbi:jg5734 [Pararge aegeria aegeria]|uniref:Jg5734 protein n=1 Tax=Pararge aegeria aegeria TaxID=348720 RepID=A0A8S4SF01_9NEOP|nr:jg5734 [Pararge aegeria aegeria]